MYKIVYMYYLRNNIYINFQMSLFLIQINWWCLKTPEKYHHTFLQGIRFDESISKIANLLE